MKVKKRKTLEYAALLVLPVLALLLLSPGLPSEAGELVQETYQKTSGLYDRFYLSNYSLDFYVDTSLADALPWNWVEGIGKGVAYNLYKFTDVVWGMTAVLAYFVGYLVEQAYSLDFISDTVTYLAGNIQKIAGVSPGGFLRHGLLPSFLPIAIIVMGAYFFYLAVVKSQLTKAASTLVAFIVMAVIGMGVIAYSGSYLEQINTFQKDFNKEVLEISGTLTVGGSENGVSGIRDSLFSVTVYEPYLLLQYGTTDVEKIGEERIARLLGERPWSREREEIVKGEVSEENNEYMSLGKVGSRLGSVLLIFVLNLVLCICVGIFTGFMIFSQIMFILYVSFLPVAFAMSLFPGNMRSLTGLLEKVFEALMKKAWITVILSVVFGLSSMCYRLTGSKNFLWTMFLQLVLFVGALMKSGELLGFMAIRKDGGDRAVSRAGSRIGSTIRTLMLGKILLGKGRGSGNGGPGTLEPGRGSGNGGSGRPGKRRTPGAGTGPGNGRTPGAGRNGGNGGTSGTGTGAGNSGGAKTPGTGASGGNGNNSTPGKGAGNGSPKVPGSGRNGGNRNVPGTGMNGGNGSPKVPGAGRSHPVPGNPGSNQRGAPVSSPSSGNVPNPPGARSSQPGTRDTEAKGGAKTSHESVRQTGSYEKPWVVRRHSMRQERTGRKDGKERDDGKQN